MLLLLFLVFLIQILVWMFYFRRGLVDQKATNGQALPALSIIVCAKNELENLRAHLPLWLAQEQVELELIIVDDGSEDGSAPWLDQQAALNPVLRILHVNKPEEYHGKRYALWKGVEGAKHDFILLTDADCAPSSNLWAARMVSEVKPRIDLVLGAAPLLADKGLVNAFARYEALYTLMLYGSAARLGQPYMGVGRNMLYRKAALDLSILKQPGELSGDDDLMVNKIARRENTALYTHPDALCFSAAAQNWKSFLRQKKRHVSTGSSYKMKHVFMLNAINGSRGLFHILALGLICFYPVPVMVMFLSRWMLMNFKMRQIFQLAQSGDLWWRIPFLDLGLSLYQLLMVPFVFLSPQQWK